MSPIQQMLLGVGAVATKTYVDDIFSTYVYKGPVTNNKVINNIDLAGEGGLVWIKHRDTINNISEGHHLYDTVRGATSDISSNDSDAAGTVGSGVFGGFNSDGFTVGGHSRTGGSGQKFASWTFRKAPGFFDVVKYTGGSGTQTISHNLNCVPGMILVKALDTSDNWAVFHRNMDATSPNNYAMKLNTDGARFTGAGWNVTATTFDAAFSLTNADGNDFIAYLFAGGESTAATARSVQLDGSGDYFTTSTSSDYTFGTGDFTIECWFNLTANPSNQPHIADNRTDGSYSNQFVLYIAVSYTHLRAHET